MMQKIALQFRERPAEKVLEHGQGRFVQLSFEAGQGLAEHFTPMALTVVVLTGRVRFTVGEDTVILEASEMLRVDPGVKHAIEGIERSTVLLVLTPGT